MTYSLEVAAIVSPVVNFTFRQETSSDFTAMVNTLDITFIPVVEVPVFEGYTVTFFADGTLVFTGTITAVNKKTHITITATSTGAIPTGTITENRVVYKSSSQIRTAINFNIKPALTLVCLGRSVIASKVTHYSAGYTQVGY